MTEIIATLITAIATIFCGVMAYHSTKYERRIEEDNKINEIRARRRIEESMLSLELINANCELTKSTALAVKRGTVDDAELDDALRKVEEAQRKYQTFLQTIAVEDMEHYNITLRDRG